MITRQAQSPNPYETLLCHVRQRLRSLNDPETDAWFIETLAADLGIPIVFGDADPVDDFVKMGEALTMSFQLAGDLEPARRAELVRRLMGVIAELMEQIMDWETERIPTRPCLSTHHVPCHGSQRFPFHRNYK